MLSALCDILLASRGGVSLADAADGDDEAEEGGSFPRYRAAAPIPARVNSPGPGQAAGESNCQRQVVQCKEERRTQKIVANFSPYFPPKCHDSPVKW